MAKAPKNQIKNQNQSSKFRKQEGARLRAMLPSCLQNKSKIKMQKSKFLVFDF